MSLRVSVGQHSDQGRKAVNQDFHGVLVPAEPLLGSKGIAVALADGIGSSEVSATASEFAVRALLDDYYCTSEAWPVRKAVERVLAATNSWLHSRTQQSPWRHDMDRGYVCTLSALVLKSATAHLFHVGDARVWRLQGEEEALEQLTEDHRVTVAPGESYLSRAVGFHPHLEIDYRALPVEPGDVFLLATDGVHEHVDPTFMAEAVRAGRAGGDLDRAARAIVDEALRRGSGDNLTVQIVVVEALPRGDASEVYGRLAALPPPALPEPRSVIDGFRIVRELHGSSRSHVYLAIDTGTGTGTEVETEALCVLKIPSVDMQSDPAALERFVVEEWIARRIDSVHVAKAWPQTRRRHHLYVPTEFIDGQTLAQWMIDHPRPDLETVRRIVEQIARGLQAFHRLEMLHRDLRPENVMIDRTGTVKLVDFGAASVAGLAETAAAARADDLAIPGAAQYAAPEYFLGEPGTPRSDLFSLAVITYRMLCGRLPYGTEVAKARTRAAQRKLRYAPVRDDESELPAWIDEVLRKALYPDPLARQETPAEFVHDLRQPGRAFLDRRRVPLATRHPVRFWQGVSAFLAVLLFLLLVAGFGIGRGEAGAITASKSCRYGSPPGAGRLRCSAGSSDNGTSAATPGG